MDGCASKLCESLKLSQSNPLSILGQNHHRKPQTQIQNNKNEKSIHTHSAHIFFNNLTEPRQLGCRLSLKGANAQQYKQSK